MQARSAAAASALLVLLAGGCEQDLESPTGSGASTPASAEAAVAANSWITRADLTTNQYSAFTTAVVPNAAGQSIVYVIGGQTAADPFQSLTRVMAYNVVTNAWSTRAPLPAGLRFANQAAVIDGKIYISGGLRLQAFYQASLYVYDPATNAWTRRHDMPNTTVDGASGVIGGRLYVLAGCSDSDDCNPFSVAHAFDRYDPKTDGWTTLPGPQPGSGRTGQACRRSAAGAVLAGRLHIIGGYGEDASGRMVAYRTHFVYDPTTNNWATAALLPTARARIAGSRVVVGGQARIEVVGGGRPGNNLQYIP